MGNDNPIQMAVNLNDYDISSEHLSVRRITNTENVLDSGRHGPIQPQEHWFRHSSETCRWSGRTQNVQPRYFEDRSTLPS